MNSSLPPSVPDATARPAGRAVLRFDQREWSGAFGDLGTLVPFLFAYVTIVGVAPAGMLLAFGIALVAAGAYFRTPFPVQPMKAIGAVAATGAVQTAVVTPQAVAVAALVTGLIWLLLSATGTTERLVRFVGRPVIIGITLGGISGFYGGWIDNVIQRFIEMVRSFPELPLWMALSAALPVNWSPVLIYFGITIILGLLDWPGLARAVRSKLLALREEDFASAAVLMGASPQRVIVKHLLPSFTSHLIASLTLSVPGMILGETALSFLGLGLRPPVTSWGVLLNEAQNINVVALYPWLMLPVVPVFIVVLAFNFFGDGLRDAADPYK